MNDSFGGEFTATQTATGGATSEQKLEGIAPVLIKQVLESAEGNFGMWGMSFGMVTCAAIVRSIDTSSTKITYLLEDHTGRVEAHYWLEEGDALKAPDIMLNNYARVFGSVRSQGGQKSLMVFKMLPITDPNEVCTHVLEVLNARFQAESFAKRSEGASGGFGSFDRNDTNFTTSGSNNIGLEGKQLAVYQAIKHSCCDEGISRDELRQKFSHIGKNNLDEILAFMISEGHVYSSLDADHFLCTE